MVTGNRTDQQIEEYSLQEELKKKKKDILPEAYIFDYEKNEFVSATLEQVTERESYYEQNPYVAPPGTPGKITPQEHENQLTALTKSLYPEKFQPGTSYGYKPEELPSLVLKQARESAIENIQTFTEDLKTRGTLQDRQAMLSLLGVQPEDYDQLLGTNREEQADKLIKQVLPEQNIESIATNPTAFIDQMQSEGNTEEKQALLTTIGFTPDEIDQIIGVQTKVMNVNGIRKQVTIKADGTVTDLTGANVGTYDTASDTISPPVSESENWFFRNFPVTSAIVGTAAVIYGKGTEKFNEVINSGIARIPGGQQFLDELTESRVTLPDFLAQSNVNKFLLAGKPDLSGGDIVNALAAFVPIGGQGAKAAKIAGYTLKEAEKIGLAAAKQALKASANKAELEKVAATVAKSLSEGTPIPDDVLKKYPKLKESIPVDEQVRQELKAFEEGRVPEVKPTATAVEKAAIPEVKPTPIPEAKATGIEAAGTKEGAVAAKVAGEVPPVKPPEVPTVTGAQPSPEGFAGNIRLSKFDPAIQGDIKAFTDVHPELVQQVRRGTVPLKETEVNAEALINQVGGDPKRLIKKVGQAYSDTEIRAIGGALSDVGNEINNLRKTLAAPGGDSVQNTLKFAELLTKHNYLQLAAIASRAEAGRALGSLRMMQDALKSGENPVMNAVLKRIGGKEGYDKVLKAMEGLDWANPVQVNNFIRNISKPKAFDYVNEIFVNSILSGPKTQIVNATTNMINTIMSPLERGVAAVVEKGLAKIQGRKAERFFAEVPEDVVGALTAMPEGVRGFWQTLKTGISPTAISKYEYRPSAFSGKVGRTVNLPVNVLEAADNLNYNINFRAAFNAEIVRLGKSQGFKGEELINFIADTKSNPPADLIKRASETAEYRLFRAEGSGIAEALYKFRDLKIPGTDIQPLKFVIPFVRTPVNIAKYGMERSPLEFFNPKLLHALRAKDPEAADMLARAFVGSTIAGAVAWQFANGKITGPTPSSQGEKDRFYREGKQPYSIKIGDKWYSYQRMEPFNTDFTLVALAVNAISNDEATIDEKVMSVVKSMGNNFASQSYLSGIADMIDAIENPMLAGRNLLQSAGQALLVPASSLTRTVAQGLDTTIRQPEGFVQKLMAGIPILSESVPPKLNVFGEPSIRQTPWYSPINISKEQDTALNRELSDKEVNIGFVGESINGVKLTDEQQRKYQELAGPMVKTAILRVIESEDYTKLSKEDARQAILNAANKAKTQARVQMIQEGTIESAPSTLSEIDKIDSKLGSVLKENKSVFSIDKPIIYDTAKYYSELKGLVANVKTSEVKDKLALAGIKTIDAEKARDALRNVKLTSLNADPSKGDTFEQLYAQSQARSKLTGADLEEFDKNPYTKDAYKGNFTRRELELLRQYHSLDKKGQAELLKQHPELGQNQREEYLKSHTEENALLTIFGQGKVLTKAAYDRAISLVKELDIPDSAVKDFLPPPQLADDYFKLGDTSEKFGEQSWESQLIKAKNPALTEWMGLTMPDTPIKSLELKVKNADIQRKYDALSDKESPTFLPDVKDATGKSPRDLAQEKLRKDNPKWVDDLRRIETIESNGEAVAEKYVEYGKKVDEFKASSAEAKLFRVDNPDLEKWGTERKDGWELIDQSKIPIWRIDAQFRKEDAAYSALKDDKARADYLTKNSVYRIARRQREAYQLFGSQTSVVNKAKDLMKLAAQEHRDLLPGGKDYETMQVMPDAESLPGHIKTQTSWAKDYDRVLKAIEEKTKPNPDQAIINDGIKMLDEHLQGDELAVREHKDLARRLGKSEADFPLVAYLQPRNEEKHFVRDFLTGQQTVVGNEISNYVTYNELPDKGYRRERFLIENPDFAKSMHDAKGIDLPTKIPSVKYDEVYEANQANFDKLNGLSDFKSKFYIEDTTQREATRRQLLFDRQGNPTKFGIANMQLEAYGKFVPDKLVSDYVGYYSMLKTPKRGEYEDDWYLQEHPDFYKEVYLGVLGNERKDYRKVPSRQVYAKYQQYQGIYGEVAKDAFRDKNRDLDAWLVTKFDYTPITEKKRRTTLTPTEKAKEKSWTQAEDWKRKLREIEGLLAGVR